MAAMPKPVADPKRPKIFAVAADGTRTPIDAVRIEVGAGRRRLSLAFAPGAVVIEAVVSGKTVVPALSTQADAHNRLAVHMAARRAALSSVLPPSLVLAVQKAVEGEDRENAPKKRQLRRWAKAALRRDAEVTVRLVGESEGSELNHDFRGKDGPTNVLTFVYDGDDSGGARAPLQGDLVLCVPVVMREAAAQGKTAESHFAHLIVHGMLHLQGYGHDDDAEATVMEGLEREILHRLGYADPYA